MEKTFIHRGNKLLKRIHIALASVAAVMLLGLGVTAGAETGAFTVIGGVEGTDYEYASNVLTIKTAEELTVSTSGSTTDRIEVTSSSGANIILDGVQINSPSAAFHILSSAGRVNVTLADGSVNLLTSAAGYAGLQKDNTAELVICGGDDGTGSLTAQGAEGGAGIGGGDSYYGVNSDVENVTIEGGIISATGGKFAAGIGGGYQGNGENITINGGAVTATNIGLGADIGGGYSGIGSNIVITGGTVLAAGGEFDYLVDDRASSSFWPGIGCGITLDPQNTKLYKDGTAVTPTNGDGSDVYLLVIPNPTNAEVIIDGEFFTPSQHPGCTELYFYLTAEEHTISVGGVETGYFFNPESSQWTQPGSEFVITGTGLKHGTDFIYPADTGVLTILTDKAITIANADPDNTTDNVIVVADGVSANITLNGVDISSADSAALEIIENTASGSVNITLADGSDNKLVSTGKFAGLQKEGANGTLTIAGSGTLTAVGGTAGIGGASAYNITINGTTVKASGGLYGGAGIGGYDGTVSNVTITDSDVTAIGGDESAGIGAGTGAVSNISISNSVVTLEGSGAAAGIGGTTAATVGSVIINGGSVKVTEGSNAAQKIGGSAAVVPTNKLDNYVYLLKIDNPDGDTVLINGTEYSPKQHSLDDTSIYAYLPADEYVVTVGDTDTPYYFDTSTQSFRCPELKVTGGRLGVDYSFDAGVVTILSDKALTIENFDKLTATSDTILIDDGVSANVTLNGVNIDSDGASLIVGNNSSLSLTLSDGTDNALASADNAISLTDGAKIAVDGTGYLSVDGGVSGGADTGFVLTGGSLSADDIAAGKVVIDGGSVKADAIAPAPVNADGASVYLLKIANPDNKTLYIDGAEYAPAQHGIDGDEKVYVYLTGEVHTVKLAKQFTYHFDSLTSTFYLPDLNVYGDNVVYGIDYTYSNGAVTILTDTPVIIENIDPDTATSDTITIAGGVDADVTLKGVNINASSKTAGTAALRVEDNSTGNVKITLGAGSENYLQSATEGAGIQKNGMSGSLEITGSGSLIVNGGWSAAGIGSGRGNSTGNITISGGVINATSGDYGAGIGGGKGGSAFNIAINNAEVTAKGGDRGAGIGGGDGMDGGSSSGSGITITNSTVNATGGKSSAGIGGGYGGSGFGITVHSGTVIASGGSDSAGIGGGWAGSASDIVINGGSVIATGNGGGAGIGGGYGGSGSYITINGGSVTAASGNTGACLGGGYNSNGSAIVIDGGSVKTLKRGPNIFGGGSNKAAIVPVNSDNEKVYLLTLENPNNSTLTIDGEEFLPKQHSSDDANVYVYLTAEAHIVKLGSDAAKTYIYDQYSQMFVVIGSDLVVTGGVYGLDYKYPVDDGVLTILTDKAMTISNSVDVDVTDHTIVIDTGVAADITLDGVNISTSGDVLTADGGDIRLTLEGGNTLNSTGGNGICVSGADSLSISGDGTLSVSGIVGISAVQASVTIDNCAVTADGGITAAETVIKGGSVKADSVTAAPTDGTENVYCLKIANPDNKPLYIDNEVYSPTQHGIDSDTNVYAYLTGETHAVKLGNEETVYVFDSTNNVFKLPDLMVTGVGVTFGTDYTYDNGVVTIKSEKSFTIANNPDISVTSDRIVTESGKTVNITLNGVNIAVTTGAPLEINGGADIKTANGTVNSLASDDDTAIAVNGSGTVEFSGDGELTADISAADATVKVTSGSVKSQLIIEANALEITGGTVVTRNIKANTLEIAGGSVTALNVNTNAPVITGGSVKSNEALTAPTDGSNPVYLLIIANPDGDNVTVNDEAYLPKQHSSADTNIYAYLSGSEDQTIAVGGEKTIYRYSAEKAKFLVVPTADMFEVELPEDRTYNGSAKAAHVTPDDASMTYTVKYYNDEGAEVNDTSAAGTYTFKIAVIGDDKYAAEVLIGSDWMFTVEGAPLDAPAGVAFTVGYGYKAEDAVFDISTGAMAAGRNVVTGEWALEYDGHFTTSGNTYTAVFTPDDTNYLSFTFTYTQVTVEAIDPVVAADPEAPRVIPGKSVTFAFTAEHPKYPEFTEGLPAQIVSISDGTSIIEAPTYTVEKNAAIDSTINISVNIAGVDGKYRASSAEAVITVAEKFNVDDAITVDTDTAVYGTDPEPHGIFGGDADGEAEWSYSFASGDVGEDGIFGSLAELYNEYGALDVGTYTVKARYEDAAHIGVGYGTFEVAPKKLDVAFKGDVSKIYDGTTDVIGYEMNADDFELIGFVGDIERAIDTQYISMEYTDINVGSSKELRISIADGVSVLTADGKQDNNYSVVSECVATVAVITRRPIIVVPAEATKTFGENDPEFTFTVENIVGNDQLGGVLGRDAGENAGTYALTLGTVTNDNNRNYDISMKPAVLIIEKAAAPVISTSAAKHSWGAEGERNIAIVGMPDDMGEIIAVSADITDTDDIISDDIGYSDGMVTYTLNTNSSANIGSNALVSVTVASQNYEDITFDVTVTVTEKLEQAAPDLKLEYEVMQNGTLKVTISYVEGAEYRFNDGEWSSVNYIMDIEPTTYITAYIRMAETESHNASEAVMVSELTPKTVVHDPVFSHAGGTYPDTIYVEITCDTDGATILYTTNGLDPLKYGVEYVGPVAISGAKILRAIAIKENMTNSNVIIANYNMTSSGGGYGSSGGHGSSGETDDDSMLDSAFNSGVPSIGSDTYTWLQIAEIIRNLPTGAELAVELNGCKAVPDYVISAIAQTDAKLIFESSNLKHWYVDGSKLSDNEEEISEAYLDIVYPVQIPSYELRGKAKWKFRINNTNLPSTLTLDVDVKNAGNFANLYIQKDGELIFVDTVRINDKGLAEFDLNEKGDYVVMACMYSDMMGDVNNDGRMNALDVMAVLQEIVGIRPAPNPVVADFNSDEDIDAMDAGAILSWIVGAAS